MCSSSDVEAGLPVELSRGETSPAALSAKLREWIDGAGPNDLKRLAQLAGIGTRRTPDERRVIRPSEVAARIGVDQSTLWRWERKGTFPKRRAFSTRIVGWLAEEIDEWEATREKCGGRWSAPRPRRERER